MSAPITTPSNKLPYRFFRRMSKYEYKQRIIDMEETGKEGTNGTMTTTNNVGHLSKHARSISVENDNNGNVLVSTPEMGVRKPTESLLFELANNLGTRDCHIDDDNGRKRMMRKNRIHKDKARRIILKASKSETDNSIPEKKSNLNKVVGGKGDA